MCWGESINSIFIRSVCERTNQNGSRRWVPFCCAHRFVETISVLRLSRLIGFACKNTAVCSPGAQISTLKTAIQALEMRNRKKFAFNRKTAQLLTFYQSALVATTSMHSPVCCAVCRRLSSVPWISFVKPGELSMRSATIVMHNLAWGTRKKWMNRSLCRSPWRRTSRGLNLATFSQRFWHVSSAIFTKGQARQFVKLIIHVESTDNCNYSHCNNICLQLFVLQQHTLATIHLATTYFGNYSHFQQHTFAN